MHKKSYELLLVIYHLILKAYKNSFINSFMKQHIRGGGKMKKNIGGKVVKRTMAVAIAVALSAGSVMPAMAVSVPEYVEGDNYVDPNNAEFNNFESTIDPQVVENVEKAQAAADAAQAAAIEAQKAADVAKEQAEEAEIQATEAETQKGLGDQALEDATKAADAAANIAGENPSIGGTAIPTSQEDNKPESAWEEVGELKDTVDGIQEDRDSWQAGMEDTMEEKKKSIDESVQDAKDAAANAEAARILAEEAVAKAQATSDINVAKAAQLEVQKAADTAADEAKKAAESYDEALAKLAEAQKYYDEMLADDEKYNIGENAKIESKKGAIEAISIDEYETKLKEAEEAYKNALSNAQIASDEADKAAQASADANESAIELAGEASEQEVIADDIAKAVIDRDVTPAKKASDDAASEVTKQEDKVKGLEKDKSDANVRYEESKERITNDAIVQYQTELEIRKQNKISAQNKLNSTPYGFIFESKAHKDARREFERAESSYNSYNNETQKNNVINDCLTKSPENIDLQNAINTLEEENSNLETIKATAAEKAKVLADAEAAKAEYLRQVDEAQEAAFKTAFVSVFKLIGESSDNINQTQYDAKLNEWANKFWPGWSLDAHIDAVRLRTDFQTKYSETSEFKKFVEYIFGIQCVYNNTEELISAVEQAYKAELKKQEKEFEKLATINAGIAKNKAEDALKQASNAATDATSYSEAANAFAEKAAAVTKELRDAQLKLDAAKETYAKAQASLKAAQAAAKDINASTVSFKTTLDLLAKAQAAVDKAKSAKEKAEADAKAALDAKNKVDSIVANWKSAPDTVTDDDGIDESAIVRTQVTAPAQLPTVQATTIDETPVALAAEPTTRRVRTVATTEEATVIEEEETPAAVEPATEEVVEEDAAVDADTTEIVDEDTALASTMQENGFAWWWILILIAVVTGGGFAGYRYYKNKKVIED